MKLFLVLAVLATACGCTGCRPGDDEKAIRDIIEKAARMAERHETSDILELTTRRFEASPGERDRDEVRTVLLFAFKQYGSFAILYARPSVAIDPSGLAARARIPFIVVREGRPIPDLGGLHEDPEGWIEEAGKSTDPYNLEIWFEKQDGDWMVDRARLDGIRPMESL
jgi:hypothetical protein